MSFKTNFEGNTDSYILFDGKNYITKHEQVTKELYQQHLEGKLSLGIIPITKDNTCKWGVIDDDSHKKDKSKAIQPYNYKKLLKKIEILGLPVTVYKSKSGGAHIKLSLDKHYPAYKVRNIIKKIAYQLCETTPEIFPKQDKLNPGDVGSALNLPYHNGNTRVAIDNEGNPLDYEKGSLYESNLRVSMEELKQYYLLSLKDFPDGRNNRLFSAANFLRKNFPKDDWKEKIRQLNKAYSEPLEERELENTVIASIDKKLYANDEEPEEAAKRQPMHYSMAEYRKLGIKKPNFIIADLIKDKSINFLFGPKGNGKTELALGFTNALARGKPFLQYDCPIPYPVYYCDFEMDGYDIMERDEAYLNYYGSDAGDYWHLLNWEQQVDQNIPDIQGEDGQNFILTGLQEQKELVGLPPLLVIDNLRSASGYDENDSNDWRPIGKWLLRLKGMGFPCWVLDHTGYDESHMRGTSSKSDWSYVNMGIKSRRVKGNPNMVMDIKFDKARGLKPSETEPFAAEYDFKGNWSLTKAKQEVVDGELCAQIIELRKADPKIIQSKISEILGVSTGKISKLMKKIKGED